MTGVMAPKHLYTDSDLAQLMRGLALTVCASSDAATPHAAAFRRGFAAALVAMALSVGVPTEALHLPDARRELPR